MFQGVKQLCYFSGHEHGTKECLRLVSFIASIVNTGNDGQQTWHSSLLYVFVGFFKG